MRHHLLIKGKNASMISVKIETTAARIWATFCSVQVDRSASKSLAVGHQSPFSCSAFVCALALTFVSLRCYSKQAPARKTSAGSTESSPARTVRRGQSFVGRRISSTSTASSSSPSGDTRPRRTTLVKGLTSEHRDSFVQIQALKKKLQGDIKSKQKTQITTLVRDDIDPAVLAGTYSVKF